MAGQLKFSLNTAPVPHNLQFGALNTKSDQAGPGLGQLLLFQHGPNPKEFWLRSWWLVGVGEGATARQPLSFGAASPLTAAGNKDFL